MAAHHWGRPKFAMPLKPLWTCPACGERFVSPRLWHSCGRHTYDALFARSEAFCEARVQNSYMPGQFDALPWANSGR